MIRLVVNKRYYNLNDQSLLWCLKKLQHTNSFLSKDQAGGDGVKNVFLAYIKPLNVY